MLYAAKFDTGGDFDNWSVGILLVCLSFTAFVILILWDPVVDCRHESWQPDELMASKPYWKRTYHYLCGILNIRGIGWNYQIPHLPRRPAQTRLRFAISRIIRVGWYLFVTDVAQTYISTNPLFSLSGDAARSMRSQGPVLIVFNVAAYMALSYCTLNIYYDAIALLAVVFGLSESKDWPVAFGKWRDAYTVRRFWRSVASFYTLLWYVLTVLPLPQPHLA